MLLSLIWMGISYGGGRKDAGHNPLDLDNVIQENHIFIEGRITKEWSDRIIVCNPDDSCFCLHTLWPGIWQILNVQPYI